MERELDKNREADPLSATPETKTPLDLWARWQGYCRFYLWLVIGCAVIVAVAIVAAVFLRVSVGLLIAVGMALGYRYLTEDELKKQLGLSCRRVKDGIAVSLVRRPEDAEAMLLPERLLWLEVTELSESTLTDAEEIRALYLPATLKRIDEGAWRGLCSLEALYFAGTAEQWEAVVKNADLSGLSVVTDHPYEQPSRDESDPADRTELPFE